MKFSLRRMLDGFRDSLKRAGVEVVSEGGVVRMRYHGVTRVLSLRGEVPHSVFYLLSPVEEEYPGYILVLVGGLVRYFRLYLDEYSRSYDPLYDIVVGKRDFTVPYEYWSRPRYMFSLAARYAWDYWRIDMDFADQLYASPERGIFYYGFRGVGYG